MRVEPSVNAKVWYQQAKRLFEKRVLPHDVDWVEGVPEQLALEVDLSPVAQLPVVQRTSHEDPFHVRALVAPGLFMDLAQLVLCHRESRKFDVLYRLFWRISSGEQNLLKNKNDSDVQRADELAKAVSRAAHKMKAFVRFHPFLHEGIEYQIAWYQPEQKVLRLVAPFFANQMRHHPWSILTPDECAHWDGEQVRYSPGLTLDHTPNQDELEDLWQSFDAELFRSVARRLQALPQDPVAIVKQERNPSLQKPSARRFIPASRSYQILAKASQSCQGCHLYRHATHTIFGEGAVPAEVMVVSEQPRDDGESTAHPLVGPAALVFGKAIRELGFAQIHLYETNAIKHFKFIARQGQRWPQKPNESEILACRPWLQAEIAMVKPKVILCMGTTAARSVLGRFVQIDEIRGKLIPHAPAAFVVVTEHPADILHMHEDERAEAYLHFMKDLRVAFEYIQRSAEHGHV